jgi:hypothetical protein
MRSAIITNSITTLGPEALLEVNYSPAPNVFKTLGSCSLDNWLTKNAIVATSNFIVGS